MLPADADELGALLEQAAELPPGSRAAFIDGLSSKDLRFREPLASLLDAHDASAGYFEYLAAAVVGPALVALAGDQADEVSRRHIERTLRPDLDGGGLDRARVGPQAHQQDIVRQILRRRLLGLAVAFGLIAGLTTVLLFVSRIQPLLRGNVTIRTEVWIGVALYTVLFAVAVVYASVLVSSMPLSLRTLRAMEVTGFTAVAACEVWRLVATWRAGEIFKYVSPTAVGMTLLSSRHSLIWFAMIAAYGVFIPNTWRRCAVVTCLLGAIPVATVGICNTLFDSLDSGLLWAYLSNMALWMMLAGAVAVYGSHRIDALGSEVGEARELGQYRLKQLIGAGGMGEVYLAEHVLLCRPCAIKLIRPDRALHPESRINFEREVRATAGLTHPNTVQVFDYGHTHDGTFYYVMEYLPGVTLDQLIAEQGPLPASRVVHLLRQICGALVEAHAVGLIHRDVKPGNIIVCERGGLVDVAKLVDFGIVKSRSVERQERDDMDRIAGTPAFMSPEQASGLETVDQRSDIYSLGGVGYFLLTGRPPFLRATAAETIAAHLGESVIPPDQIQPDVPTELQAIILRCLSKSPGHRYQSAAALCDALTQSAVLPM